VPAPVLHQFQGAYLAEHFYKIKDEDIINAIRFHTSGRANMSALEKLIFLADMVEDGRDYDGVEMLRALFYSAQEKGEKLLDACLLCALEETVKHLKNKGGEIYPLTLQAYEFYRGLAENKKNKA
jgi:nicotinate-nucleotide adenylyltransferase